MGLSTGQIIAYKGGFSNAEGDNIFIATPRPASSIDTGSSSLNEPNTGGLWLSNIFAGNNSYDMPNSGKEDKKPKDWGAIFQTVGSGIGSLVSGLQQSGTGGILGGLSGSDYNYQQAQYEQQRRQQRNTTIGIVVGVGVLGLVGYGIYASQKK